ncbi:MAG TPA: SpoIIE family protein phosphatase [Sporichthyaceae bacterium]|nr:SpoIIE family protein phosphatase [Sporichthyaceae bacterium]
MLWAASRSEVAHRLPALAALCPSDATVVLVPLTVDERRTFVGVLGLHFPDPRPPAAGDQEFLTAAGDLLGQGLQRVRLSIAQEIAKARSAAAASRAQDLAALAAALGATVTVDDVTAALSAHVQRAVACQTFSLREVGRGLNVARAIRVAGTPIGYRERFTDVRLDLPSAMAEVAATGNAVFLTSAEDNRRRFGPEAAEQYDSARIEALARLPLFVEAELIAILSVGHWAPREFSGGERLFLTTVADLAAQALGRALRTRRLHQAARRHRLSSAAQAAINRRLDPTEELQGLARAVVPELADFSSVHVLHRPVAAGSVPELPVITDRVASVITEGVEPLPLQNGIAWWGEDPITETIRSGRLLTHPLPTPTVPEWADRTGSAGTFKTGLNHLVLAPVLVDGLVVAVASFGMCDRRPAWDEADLRIIEEIAGYAAVAFGHGLRYQRTRRTALVLQRSLLSAPPEVPGLQLCGRYQPAGSDEVGGDWYDAFETAPGRLAVAVGDVVGHDITAAAAMGQLRAVLRALAMDEDLDPCTVLDRLADANRCLHIAAMATVLFARLHRGSTGWTMRWASAGHPQPLLVEPDGSGRRLGQPTGVALVASLPPFDHRSTQVDLDRPDSTLLLYTDGLVERRGIDLNRSITQLCSRAGQLADRPLPELCDTLLADSPGSDDTALLAVRVASTTQF